MITLANMVRRNGIKWGSVDEDEHNPHLANNHKLDIIEKEETEKEDERNIDLFRFW